LPNAAHLAVAELERLGKLDCIITQNVDNLHQKAGNSTGRVFELHGNLRMAACLDCGKRYPLNEVVPLINDETGVPDCPSCRGMLKPAAVFFGEALPVKELTEASHRARNCDLMLVIGSTLVVYPAAYMPIYAHQSGAKLVIINLSSTPMDGKATILMNAKAGEAMDLLMKHLRLKLVK
jgi:NAD-dependent deacetylase